MPEKFTIVAFRYDRKRSLLYRNHSSAKTIARQVEKALDLLKADVISIRRVYEERPQAQKKF